MKLRRYPRATSALALTITLVVLVLAGIVMVAPFAWIFRGAISPTDAVLFKLPPDLIPEGATLENFGRTLQAVPFARFFLNSVTVASAVTVAQIVTCSTAAYAFARLKFRGSNILFALILGALMIPLQATIVPLFLVMSKLQLTNTLWALILPGVFSAFGIFLLRQHFLSLPESIEEAAKIDGAGHFRIYAQIAMPLAGPALATLAILTFTHTLNELLLPLVMINDTENQTLPVGLVLLAGRFEGGTLTMIAAGITMAVLPVLVVFLILQRRITQSVASSGIKL